MEINGSVVVSSFVVNVPVHALRMIELARGAELAAASFHVEFARLAAGTAREDLGGY